MLYESPAQCQGACPPQSGQSRSQFLTTSTLALPFCTRCSATLHIFSWGRGASCHVTQAHDTSQLRIHLSLCVSSDVPRRCRRRARASSRGWPCVGDCRGAGAGTRRTRPPAHAPPYPAHTCGPFISRKGAGRGEKGGLFVPAVGLIDHEYNCRAEGGIVYG